MAVQGAYTAFDLMKLKTLNGTVNLSTDSFFIVLCDAGQVLSPGFTGTSGNAQYSDLTNELPTANGYTVGGVALPLPALSLLADIVTLGAGDPSWSLTGGGITFKYAVIFDNTTPNKDLLFYVDMDTSGGSVAPIAGTMTITTAATGIETWE